MSELKEHAFQECDEIFREYHGILSNEVRRYYLKSEADKVIAEKDKKIDLYKRGWEESDRINEHLYAQLRHSNYKRCLAMAQWCMDAECKTEKDADFLVRWDHRWLALAEEPTWAKFLQLIHKEVK